MSKEKEKKETTVLDVIKAIHQAATDAYDGGEKLGLDREVENPTLEPRSMDGFGVHINGKTLRITYHGQVELSKMASQSKNQILNQIEAKFSDIEKYLKKHYRTSMKQTLTLKPISKEVEANVESARFNRSWVKAHKDYEVSNIKLDEQRKRSWSEMVRGNLENLQEERLKELDIDLPYID